LQNLIHIVKVSIFFKTHKPTIMLNYEISLLLINNSYSCIKRQTLIQSTTKEQRLRACRLWFKISSSVKIDFHSARREERCQRKEMKTTSRASLSGSKMTFQHPRAHHFAPPTTPWRHSSARGTWLITWLGRAQSTSAQYSSPERWETKCKEWNFHFNIQLW
jgi:hypothetical protein